MTPDVLAPLVVQLVKYLAWPTVVAIIALRLGPKLLDVLRGRKVDIRGFGFQATVTAIEQQQVTKPESAASPARAPALVAPAADPVLNRPALQTLQRRLAADVERVPQGGREAALLSAWALSRLVGAHEFIYNRIFGSQIAGLKALDETGPKTVAQAREFFEPIAQQWPQVYQSYGFDGWLTFLVHNELVTRAGEVLTITEFGHDFLIYLAETRLTAIKPG
jgi:hypothetical protein